MTGPAGDRRCHGLRLGFTYYYLTSFLVVLGVLAGVTYLQPAHRQAPRSDFFSASANRDGQVYAQILRHGYEYDPDRQSSVAFFPAFPLLGALVARATGLGPETSLLLVSHASLAAAFIVLYAYVGVRFPTEPGELPPYVLLALGLWPTSFFFRMAYSESLFLLASVSALYAMERRWPMLVVALLVGFATATRSVGVVLLAPLLLDAWRRSRGTEHFLQQLWIVPVACWGILAYMLYQYLQFGDPLAFARTQQYWSIRPNVPWPDRIIDLATFEPVRAVYDPSSPCCWDRSAVQGEPLLSLHFANPLYVLLAIALVAWGWRRALLTPLEITLAAGLILLPYLLRGHEMCMTGMGRFVAVAFPIYLVAGRLLQQLPAPMSACILAVSGFLMGFYAALFAASYPLF